MTKLVSALHMYEVHSDDGYTELQHTCIINSFVLPVTVVSL